jgi:hypothetical protein
MNAPPHRPPPAVRAPRKRRLAGALGAFGGVGADLPWRFLQLLFLWNKLSEFPGSIKQNINHPPTPDTPSALPRHEHP